MAALYWNGVPILYRRGGGGHGLIVGARHYRFAPNGDLQFLDELNEMILKQALKLQHGDRAGLVFAANAKTQQQLLLQAKHQASAKKG